MHSDRYVTIAIRTQNELQESFIPFLKKGGIIIPSEPTHEIGYFITLAVELLDYPRPFEVVGKIAWLTPEHTQIEKLRGTGVEFVSGDDVALCKIMRDHFRKPDFHQSIESHSASSPQLR